VLLSAPSIVIGLFVYSVYVARVKALLWLGGCSRPRGSINIIDVCVVRTSDDMLKLVPNSLREAARRWACPTWKMILSVTYPAARTGSSPASSSRSRASAGKRPPLLFTALNNQFWFAAAETSPWPTCRR